MDFTLRSDCLTVEVEAQGAQLKHIRMSDGVERLWQGDPHIWARRAPILFPIIGRLREGRYTMAGEEHTISMHGFARDLPFTPTRQEPDSLTLALTHTPQTLAVYPRPFTLEVTYRLEGSTLVKSHRVTNTGPQPMWYELGGHDGFRVALLEGETDRDYAVRLPGASSVTPYGMDPTGLITPKGAAISLEEGLLDTTPASYGLDTVVLDRLPDPRVELVRRSTGAPVLTMDYDDFSYLGIWTAAQEGPTGYVCLEPWTTLPDASFVDPSLEHRPGIRRLDPGAQEVLTYSTTFYPV